MENLQGNLFVQDFVFEQPADSADQPRHILVGEVLRLTYRDEVTGYVVGAVRVHEGAAEVRFRGTDLFGVDEGAVVRFEGEWEQHPEYGRQFVVRRATFDLPVTVDACVRYIAANIKGCGPKLAQRIVAYFGTQALQVLAREPERIREVFPSAKMAERQVEQWKTWADKYRSERAVQEVYLRLLGTENMTPSLARRIVERFGPDEARRVVFQRPYDLVQVSGVGFKTADALARGLGIADDDPMRLAAGVVYVLGRAMEEGHSALPHSLLESRARRMLGVQSSAAVREAIDTSLARGHLVERDGLVFTAHANHLEHGVANFVALLLARPSPLSAEQRATIEQVIGQSSTSPAQADAIRRAFESPLFVLTGRPGSGKTTTLRTFLRCCDALGWRDDDVVVVAPTGKAASRASEVTGRKASTIHRLLNVPFPMMRTSPLRYRWVILEEASMCDLAVFEWLLRNLDLSYTSLLVVGDVYQLPSVGHGQVLADLLESGVVPYAMLTEVFRQGANSLITLNANRVLDRQPLVIDNSPGSDFVFADVTINPPIGPDGFPIDDPDRSRKECIYAQERIRRAVAYLIREGADPVRDVHILSPMKRGLLGVAELNRVVQDQCNPNGKVGPRLGDGFSVRVGDRVIQTRNDYELDLFNGDQGRVLEVGPDFILARFYDSELKIDAERLSTLALSWAITVHRSQGSEFPFTVLAYHTSHYVMLSRSLLYTAITRAKNRFILIGSREAMDYTIRRGPDAELRYTGLARLIAGAVRSSEPQARAAT